MPLPIRNLYAITPDTADLKGLLQRAEACLAGGASVLQYRNKAPQVAHLPIVKGLATLCRQFGVPLIVNDDVDLALAGNAHGVHLGRDDGDVATAREKLGKDSIIGISCYGDIGLALSAQAAGADYVAFGSMFASTTKPQAPAAPLSLLTQAKALLHIPIVAIGGITLQNAPLVIAAGADAVAVISAVFDAPDIKRAAEDFSNLFQKN